ncbi:MAG: glycerophosphodiester phosphodiesterase [Elusimicrobia bacterium]|nr:glycerophosphodiester phosphodiesterase [Elusimicrobiota bacterium]
MLLLISSSALCAAQAAPAVKVHGHRGTRGMRPENTLAAFREALRVGVDALELDMGVTKDDAVVVSHDQRVNPDHCLDAAGKPLTDSPPIRVLTLKQFKSYDCGSLRNPRFPDQVLSPGERMPTLDEVFELVARSTYPAAKTVEFNIETKIVPSAPELSPEPERFALLVAAAVERRGLASRVILQSFDYRTLAALRKRLPQVRLSLLTSDNLFDLSAAARSLGADFVSPDQQWITKDEVRRLHADGVQVLPWTVNDEAGWDRMIELGVDGIITDYPERLIAYLRARKLRP